MIKALIVDQADDGSVSASIREIEVAQLPDDGEVDIAVEYSTINYKDGLCLNGLGRLVRTYPHVPGIDLAGTVISSRADGIAPGDRVTMNGFRSGEIRWGGYATQANGKAEWIVKLPDGMSTRHSQMLGTAGFTAMQSILRLEANGMTPDGGEVLVTGAGGGVGSVATVLLAKRGYQVAAMTGRAEIADYLTGLGASRIVSREDMLDDPGKPMESGVWGGCIDCVGGQILARAIKQMNYGCGIASLGNTAGVKMEASIIPFLLRGVAVLGIDSVMVPVAEREKIWAALDAGMPRDVLESMSEEIGLADVPEYGKKILEGKVRGRILVNVNQ
ncbi:MAG: acryloyl-CoA reductase [Pseudomonadota bacterium]|nr:acryloyl-CoA reductase [Pseudomonadota bacterium]